ncbi:MAG: DUF1573 domain-containing protein [Bacteroidales bacterium]|nr:DUF1573 domain-containing protein [Bacteroidales bacterium]
MKKFMLLLAGFALITMFNSFSEAQPESSQEAKIEFEKTVHDFGTIPQHPKMSDDAKCKFSFRNAGDEPLVITGVRSSCGCTTPKYTQEPILPGESGDITVQYDNRRVGYFAKTITVNTNGKPASVVLTIKGKVEKQASGEPVKPTTSAPQSN